MPNQWPAILVHGGAGKWEESDRDPAVAGCRVAADLGLARLARGESALEAAVAAVRSLEDDPVFNAGIGSCLTRDGTVEVDAGVMEGTTLRFGGIAAMRDGYPAIDIARAVMENGPHVLLCGEGAWAFARGLGFSPRDLVTQRAREKWQEGRAEGIRDVASRGTVGAVAIDREGRVAAATSTGGMIFKRAGRIGDTPICGAGTYADDEAGAASATGHGEAMIRLTMTRFCVDRMRAGASAAAAARDAIATLRRTPGSTGGIICCDARGGLGAAHDTPAMPHAGGTLDASGSALVTAQFRCV